MEAFRRYAVFQAPSAGPLADFGAAWLGWDAVAGRAVAQPQVAGLDMAAATRAPRRYGFHGTLKPPFGLAEGCSEAALAESMAGLAAGLAPVALEGLRLARMGGFLALVPKGDTAALGALAARVVEGLDGFRAPPGAAELARRRSAGLTARQEALLRRWGYPYVMEEFRFHLTLTGKLDPQQAGLAEAALARRLEGVLPRPFVLADLCLFGEVEDGHFRLIRRVPLGA